MEKYQSFKPLQFEVLYILRECFLISGKNSDIFMKMKIWHNSYQENSVKMEMHWVQCKKTR